MHLQPLLHDLLAAMTAPTQAWSGRDGQVRRLGAHGIYHGDVRVLSQAVLRVDGHEPEVISSGPAGPGAVEVIALVRGVDEPGADPTVRLRRVRTVAPGSVHEVLELTPATVAPVRVPLALHLACDLADMEQVKSGRGAHLRAARTLDDAVVWSGEDGRLVHVAASGADVDLVEPREPVLSWSVEVQPGAPMIIEWELWIDDQGSVVSAAPPAAEWPAPVTEADDRRLPSLLRQSLEDLESLRMSTSATPDEVFLAAGAPWFFTLFGRDSIWGARMMLPLGTELAAGTLRTLAARQGRVTDPGTAEEPGKILHEVRDKPLPLGEAGGELPPLYYGTVDATPLWVCLLHDAWRWGMPSRDVEALLPNMEAALRWMDEFGDADGDGFVEYLDPTGRGLANQGWKDSGDSVQWRDGSLADGPIALCEVQAYAYEAAMGGAALLDAFGRPGGDVWRAWAARLAERFRDQFWISDGGGDYPAIALDGGKRPVDTLTSNVGHLLGTGLLDTEEEALVARRLASSAMDSGYGLRTLSTDAGGYWPMRYHGGAVWTHDTAIAVAGLARCGHTDVAANLIEGLLAAGSEFGYRLPELYSGDARGTVPRVVPYPAACQPQAWSAAAAVLVLKSILGLEVDVPGGSLQVRPLAPSPVGAVRIRGLRIAGHDLDVEVGADGGVHSVRTDAPIDILRGQDVPELDRGRRRRAGART
jgi:glycogen debranching enzyme